MKRGILKFLLPAVLLSIILLSWDPAPKFKMAELEQHPPIPTEFWVQQLKKPKREGNMIVRVNYASDVNLPRKLPFFLGKTQLCTLRDDGVFPDDVAKDQKYSTLISQDPHTFKQVYQNKLDKIRKRGFQINYTGHLGRVLGADEFKTLDIKMFDQFEEVLLNPNIINEPECEVNTEIDKPKSLWIADLRVVEDPARTYNIVEGTGNPIGVWTFGHLMKNMAGGLDQESSPEQVEKVRDFLKTWVIGEQASYSLNDFTTNSRSSSSWFRFIIRPWLSKAKNLHQSIGNATITEQNWQEHWADVSIDALLSNAPFKLSAIVNRMDLRGNGGYSGSLSNSGETRFVYSLISAYNYGVNNNMTNIGMPPNHLNISPEQVPNLDWQGMNVILEYGNVESEKCNVKQRAQDWIDLSDLNMDEGLDEYLSALELLTNTVTDAGAKPGNPNGSAINQVRSNEQLMAELIGGPGATGWRSANWQLRQFELNEQGLLVNAPVTNVPYDNNNFTHNTNDFDTPTSSTELIDWIYGVNQNQNFVRVAHGNHNLPTELLQPVSEMKGKLLHYFGLDFWNDGMKPSVFNKVTYNGESSEREKTIRRQISLNTCAGCHGSETKTFFTMVRPLGYGEEANYWDLIPATHTGRIDARFYDDGNIGKTLDDFSGELQDNYKKYYYVSNDGIERTVPIVSPFITGRNFRGSNGLWQDDAYSNFNHPDNNINDLQNDLGDDDLTGMFYVNDPSNNAIGSSIFSDDHVYPQDSDDSEWQIYHGPFPQVHNSNDSRIGFNELDLRSKDLCRLAHSCCSQKCNQMFSLIEQLNFIPFPEHGN